MDEPVDLLRGARSYRPTTVVRAHRLGRPRTWRTARGSELSAAAGDWLVTDGTEEWTVAPEVFLRSYRPLRDGRFAKVAPVQAAQLDRGAEVSTLEGVATAEPGDWVLRGVEGELWTVTDAFFRTHYEPD